MGLMGFPKSSSEWQKKENLLDFYRFFALSHKKEGI